MADVKSSFTGSIPEYYDRCLGPAYFDAFAADLAQRLPPRPPGAVLEIACGTGCVTRYLRERLDPALRLVATDLSKPMLDQARRKLDARPGIEWREADACRLPFGDGEFGAVVCAFGIMFVPDKGAALREMRRVLRDGGLLLMNVWDRIEESPHALAMAETIEGMFPGDAEMRFRVPFEMADPAMLRRLLADAGFGDLRIGAKSIRIDGVSALSLATGQVRGTPRALLIEQRGVKLETVIEKGAAALAKIGGADPYRAPAKALVIEARAPARA